MINATNTPKKRTVKFEYVGTDEQFVNFLKCVIRDYVSIDKTSAEDSDFMAKVS